MPGLFGLNVLGQYVPDINGLLSFARRLNPAAFLVMDSSSVFQSMQQTVPSAIAIYRTYHPQDAEFHSRFAPAAWLDTVPSFGGYTACGNEPNGYGDVTPLVVWYVQIMRLARQRGRRLAVCGFGVGHPDDALIKAGAFDGLIRELADGYHLLMLHEYARDSTVTERPYHIGRFQFWRDRAAAIGVAAPRIVLTEYGRDNVGNGTGGGINDGWRGAGLSEQAYAAFLQNAAGLYSAADIPLCIFCYGSGAGGAWQSFNIDGAAQVQSDLVTANGVYQVNMSAQPPVSSAVPKPPNAGTGALALLNAPVDGINLRDAPDTSGKRLATLMDGAPLVWYRGGTVQADGYTWYWVELATGAAGWMACLKTDPLNQFEPAPTEPPVEPSPATVISVPYYSQITSPGAEKDTADCGETSVRMVIGWLLKRGGVPDFAGLTIDDLTRDAGKKVNAFLSMGQVEQLLRLYGLPNARLTYGGVTLKRITEEIDAGQPLIALVRYQYIKPGDAFTGGHWVVVVGYTETHIILHDPYRLGANARIPRAQFEAALTQWGTPPINPSRSGVFVA